MKTNEAMTTLADVIGTCQVSDVYGQLYGSLSQSTRFKVNLQERHLSYALYYHLCKIKYAGWRYRVAFKRGRKHSIADIFQDLLAFYLRAVLPSDYDIRLEVTKKGAGENAVTTQADILITRGDRKPVVIEAKTTIGWARPNFKGPLEERYLAFSKRISDVAKNFTTPKENVIYVFEEPTNVHRKHFLPLFWSEGEAKGSGKPASRTALTYPVSQIYPLFMTTDPYYWDWPAMPSDRDRTNWCPDTLTDEAILKCAGSSIVTPFEKVVDFIQKRLGG